ncbi:hypothetical protein M422DRAFT_51249 [Sphaerobolus stellatus SS14]|uniref:Uncharacterized protein n=1 Tax=Sphaerobolus stellatus (strain SS14) TaxID=990650 RepID=A0A0C9UMI6_SPHS4|nr:hypothetical protein M422DRAFT_51249 [Sphaerobolus stellatus SS14]
MWFRGLKMTPACIIGGISKDININIIPLAYHLFYLLPKGCLYGVVPERKELWDKPNEVKEYRPQNELKESLPASLDNSLIVDQQQPNMDFDWDAPQPSTEFQGDQDNTQKYDDLVDYEDDEDEKKEYEKIGTDDEDLYEDAQVSYLKRNYRDIWLTSYHILSQRVVPRRLTYKAVETLVLFNHQIQSFIR